jgi:DNA-binding NtrC family response regulator
VERLRILVVDDEIALANLIEKYLQRMGFEVEPVSDSRLALERFRAAKVPFHLVLADLTMPQLSGEELLRTILRSDPNVRAILCSGYAMAGSPLEQEYGSRIEFLQKPFFPKMLADAIGKLLGPSSGFQPASSSAS